GNEAANDESVEDGWFRTGDLGRIDGEGRLYIVGRQKDVIVDGDGRNVYPDEIEEAYGKHSLISEISVVGLDQGAGERVAALVVPTTDSELNRSQVRDALQEHFKATSESLPFHKRIKILEVWDGELPKTAKRSVKRAEVVKVLERLQAAGRVVSGASETGDSWLAVRDIIATLTGQPAASVTPELRVNSDLAFDSLTFMELTTQLERLAGHEVKAEDLMAVDRVGEIAKLVDASSRAGRTEAMERVTKPAAQNEDDPTVELPRPIQDLGRRFLTWGQRQFFDKVMECDIIGAEAVPVDSTFIVAANHASHLDAGLIKTALGDYGKNLVALAARDYFWGSPIVRTYTVNFTKLVPMFSCVYSISSLPRVSSDSTM
ncbi:MAG: phosphopantetheine-binding protein, partial [Myxococcota bacterium]